MVIIKIVVIMLIIAAFLVGLDFVTIRFSYNRKRLGQRIVVPTLFIHGYQGNLFSFGHMIRRLQRHFGTRKEMIIIVKKDGQLKVKGKLSHLERLPLIQLIFQNNRATELQQRDWLNKVVRYLREQEQVTALNAVAHSMGGVSLLHFLVGIQPLPRRNNQVFDQLPHFKKIVTIGVPFNDISVSKDTPDAKVYELTPTGPEKTTKRYRYFERKMKRLPKDLQILNIAGDVFDAGRPAGDGSVGVDSAFSLRFLVKSQIADYQELLVKGRRAAHRLLHENRSVDEAIATFLWGNIRDD